VIDKVIQRWSTKHCQVVPLQEKRLWLPCVELKAADKSQEIIHDASLQTQPPYAVEP
jgi:hypothetical protein